MRLLVGLFVLTPREGWDVGLLVLGVPLVGRKLDRLDGLLLSFLIEEGIEEGTCVASIEFVGCL